MTTPLSAIPSSQLNFSTPPTTRRFQSFEARSHAAKHSKLEGLENEEGDSSPFVTQVEDENMMDTRPGNYQEQQQKHAEDEARQTDDSSPSKRRANSRILSGTELSPLKILQHDQGSQERSSASPSGESHPAALASPAAESPNLMPPPPPRSARKVISPIRRFPVKIRTQGEDATPRASPSRTHERHISLDEAVQENEGLKHAIEIFEDDASGLGIYDDNRDMIEVTATVVTTMDGAQDGGVKKVFTGELDDGDDLGAADDTMISDFSTFSVVPNMTMLARMHDGSASPAESLASGATPRGRNDMSPQRTARPCMAGTVNDNGAADAGGNTTNLIDFTEQLRFGNYAQGTPSRRGRGSPTRATANLLGNGAATIASTPQRRSGNPSSLVNLLDFDMPPLPTPRSIPTITPRELESLKSNFLSEISSLKASLSGKEAEVSSLKTAVGDAEKRVGECMEELREVKSLRESLEAEKDGWEKRGREMESVLRKVKEEIVMGQRDREELEFKLDEAEKRREAAEMMAQEAESKMAGMRAGKAAASNESIDGLTSPDKAGSRSPSASNREVEMAVERVARELHALYKSKHETKVAALKKSYENRWEKKVRELQAQVDELVRDNDELRVGRDATLTRVDLAKLNELEQERKAEKARDAEQIAHLTAEIDKLEAVVKSFQADNAELRIALERERVEKGELVILAEEMMNMQQSFVAGRGDEEQRAPPTTTPRPMSMSSDRGQMPPPATGLGIGASSARNTPSKSRQQPQSTSEPGTGTGAGTSMGYRGNRASMLRGPGGLKASASGSRIGQGGAGAAHERTRSAATSGVPRPGSGLAVRSGGLMSSIEKMGNYGRGRGGE